MNHNTHEAAFGAKLIHTTGSAAKLVTKKYIRVIAASAITVACISSAIYFDDPVDLFYRVGSIALAVLAFGCCCYFAAIKLNKSVTVYERGVVIEGAKGEIKLGFDEIKGINYKGTEITKKDDKTVGMKFFKIASDELLGAFDQYLMKDLTQENILNASMTFGHFLTLENGEFIHKSLTSKKASNLKLEDVEKIEIEKCSTNDMLYIRSASRKGTIAMMLDLVLNVKTLFHVVALYKGEV